MRQDEEDTRKHFAAIVAVLAIGITAHAGSTIYSTASAPTAAWPTSPSVRSLTLTTARGGAVAVCGCRGNGAQAATRVSRGNLPCHQPGGDPTGPIRRAKPKTSRGQAEDLRLYLLPPCAAFAGVEQAGLERGFGPGLVKDPASIVPPVDDGVDCAGKFETKFVGPAVRTTAGGLLQSATTSAPYPPSMGDRPGLSP